MGANNGIIKVIPRIAELRESRISSFINVGSPTCIFNIHNNRYPPTISYDIILAIEILITTVLCFGTSFFFKFLLLLFLFKLLSNFTTHYLVTWSPGGSIIKVNNMITNKSRVHFNLKVVFISRYHGNQLWFNDLRATRVPFRLIRHSIIEVIMFLLYFWPCAHYNFTTLVLVNIFQFLLMGLYDWVTCSKYLFNCRSRSIG